MTEATNVKEMLDRFEQQDWNRHTGDAYETIESFTREVVEQGEFIPDAEVHADLELTLRERITGNREQDVTAFLVMGLMLGSALERDVPMDSEEEDLWREGEFTLPEGDE